MEIKGVTLEEDGVVRFPDAPTERGVKHVKELMEAVKEGYEAYVFFVIQMKGVKYFTPNVKTHPEFAEALREASERGVKILAYDCEISHNEICDIYYSGVSVGWNWGYTPSITKNILVTKNHIHHLS